MITKGLRKIFRRFTDGRMTGAITRRTGPKAARMARTIFHGQAKQARAFRLTSAS